MEEGKKKRGIQSINVGFSILKALMQSQYPLPLKEISEQIGLSPSKIHSYLVSFQEEEMVQQNPETGFYSLGTSCLKLGLAYLDQFDLTELCKPHMRQLANDLGHTIFLGVWGNRGPTIIYRLDGTYSETLFDLRIGSVLPILTSAVGKNFAAHLPENRVMPSLIEELKSNKGELNLDENLRNVEEMLATIKKDGISQGRAEMLSDLTAISVPIFDFSNNMIAGLTIMGKIGGLDDRINGSAAKMLKQAAFEISQKRGYKVLEQNN
ncbi:transcriptional regulator, IclR family [Soonwooa buanensis]|uniref:Transcriptional regulator, IclR family n=1 Tax=Soonwooa buanensis TaxID=619805 RepID=A0A1T5EDT1_9FLAO|nr:IclR family transcriptional regulator [Soonwooa buanensis]SKB81968.1 transcriptional regulator, IclR family [Soonwooa buanensis]